MKVIEELIKLANVHPILTTILIVSAIGGVTAVGVTVVNNIGNVAGKAIDKGTGFAVNNGKFAVSMNQSLIPFAEMPAIEQVDSQQA